MWELCQNPHCSDCAGGSATPRGRKLLLGRALAVAPLHVGIVLPPVSPHGSISPSYQYARARSSAFQLGSIALSSVFWPPIFFVLIPSTLPYRLLSEQCMERVAQIAALGEG